MKTLKALLFVSVLLSASAGYAQTDKAWHCDKKCTKKHIAVPNVDVARVMVKFVESAYKAGEHKKLPHFLVSTYLRMKENRPVHVDEWKDSAQFIKEALEVHKKRA